MSNHTKPGDVVLVHVEEKAAGYARVEEIRSHARAGWYECDLLFLGQPLQPVTWILEREQIDGVAFSMGGRQVRIEPLAELGGLHGAAEEPRESPTLREAGAPKQSGEKSPKPRGKVVRLVPREGDD